MTGPPRTPPQGGLPPVHDPGPDVVDVACDESGFSGSNMLDPSTPLITHATVDLDVVEAAALVAELVAQTRWSRTELKSGPALRGPRADRTRALLLSALGGHPADHAHAFVVDKEFFLATRVVDLLVAEPSWGAGTRLTDDMRPAAVDLYRAGRTRPLEWRGFLTAFVDLVRTTRRAADLRVPVDRLLTARDDLRAATGAGAPDVLGELRREQVAHTLDRVVRGEPGLPPPLEPLLPALAETVLHWAAGRRPVLVTHDEQSALTATRLRQLQRVLPRVRSPRPAPDASPRTGAVPTVASEAAGGTVPVLAGLVSVDSRDDPRVQVADLLAAVVRRTPDVRHDEWLAPLVSPTSLWDHGP